MIVKKSKPRLEISLIISLVFLVVILLIVWFLIRLFDSAEEKIKFDLEIEMARIERSFVDKMDYTFSIIKSINSQIAEDPKNKNHIDAVLRNYRNNPSLTKIFSWTVFSWTNEDHKIIVNSKNGVLKDAVDLSIRPYALMTEKEPEKFHLGNPIVGIITNKWLVPGGVGITDENGKFLGATIIGFEIAPLAKLLHNVVQNTDVQFSLFARNDVPILYGNFQSFSVDESNDDATHNSETSKILNEIAAGQNAEIFSISFINNSHAFLAKKIDGYPYILFLKYNEKAVVKELIYLASSRLIEILSVCFGLLILLLLIYREKKQSDKIIALKQAAEHANSNKSEFLIKAAHEFKNFAFGIHGCAEIIKGDLKSLIAKIQKDDLPNKQNYLHELEIDLELSRDIIESSHDLDNFLNDLLDLNYSKDGEFKIKRSSRPVNVAKIIKQAANSLTKRAKNSDIILLTKIENALHQPLHIDPHRFKQIITNLIANAIKYSQSGDVVEISARNVVDAEELKNIFKIHGIKKSKLIEVLVKDQGIGMTEGEVKASLQNIKNMKNLDTLTLGLPILKYLIEKQGGIFDIQSRKNEGSEIRIII